MCGTPGAGTWMGRVLVGRVRAVGAWALRMGPLLKGTGKQQGGPGGSGSHPGTGSPWRGLSEGLGRHPEAGPQTGSLLQTSGWAPQACSQMLSLLGGGGHDPGRLLGCVHRGGCRMEPVLEGGWPGWSPGAHSLSASLRGSSAMPWQLPAALSLCPASGCALHGHTATG